MRKSILVTQGQKFDCKDFVEAVSVIGAPVELREYIRAKGLTPVKAGVNWPERLQEYLEDSEVELTENDLLEFYRGLRYYGRKDARIIEFDSTVYDSIRSKLSQIVVPKSKYQEVYPLPILEHKTLMECDPSPILTDLRELPNMTIMAFCSPRWEQAEYEVPPELMAQDLPEELRGATFYAKKQHWLQAFDIACFHHRTRTLLLGIDVFSRRSENGGHFAFGPLENKVESLIGVDNIQWLDLSPAFHTLYCASEEGSVVDLGFNCYTGFRRRETLRSQLRQNASDLRTEKYHCAGKNALLSSGEAHESPFDIFRISVRWDNPFAVLTLKRNIGVKNVGKPATEAEFPEFLSPDGFSFALGKLYQYAGRQEDDDYA